MQLANRGKYTFLKDMRVRKYYANPKLLLATTCLLEYSQYVRRRFKNITLSNININFETLTADLMPNIRSYNKRDR